MVAVRLGLVSRWWAIVLVPFALALVGLSFGLLSFGIYLIVLLVVALLAIFSAITLVVLCVVQRRWLAAAAAVVLPVPLLFFWSLIDVGIYCSDWAYFRSNRTEYLARVAKLPPSKEPRFLALGSEQLGSALTGPIERSIVYDESGGVAGPTEKEAVSFRRKFFRSKEAADDCVKYQRIRSLGDNFYVVRGQCEFPQY